MDKIALELLAPYLPYGLNVQYNNGDEKNIISVMTGIEDSKCILTDMHMLSTNGTFKPILRPLSDLISARTVYSYGDMVTFADYIDGDFDLGSLRWVLPEVAKGQQLERLQDLPYCVWRELFKYHFDVFSLIEKGLAIDINSIKEKE